MTSFPKKKVSFYTLGCRLNQAETALMAESFRIKGYAVVEHGESVDVAVINTCSVTDRADARGRHEIRKIRRRAPGAVVCAVGCYAQSEPDAIRAILGVNLVVGTDQKFRLAEILEQETGRRDIAPREFISRRPDAAGIEYPPAGYYPLTTRANIKVQDGCNFGCTFCLLPRVRGPARSRPFEEVVAEGRTLAARGHRELVVTGVNVGLYASGGKRLADVLQGLSDIPHVDRVRLSSIEPSTVDGGVIDWMAGHPKACRHLHLPLQSGDDETLSAMRRVYTVDDYARFVDKVKSLMPDLGLGADVMVGFPGETDKQFERSVRFVESLPFSYLHIFPYSDRPRTAAGRRPGKVPPEMIDERATQMRELAGRKKNAFFRAHLGRSVEVLFESVDGDGLRKGFTRNYLRVGAAAAETGEKALVWARIIRAGEDFCLAG